MKCIESKCAGPLRWGSEAGEAGQGEKNQASIFVECGIAINFGTYMKNNEENNEELQEAMIKNSKRR